MCENPGSFEGFFGNFGEEKIQKKRSSVSQKRAKRPNSAEFSRRTGKIRPNLAVSKNFCLSLQAENKEKL